MDTKINFLCIAGRVDISQILVELEQNPEAWYSQRGRQASCPAQTETLSIPLRGLCRSKICGRRRRDVHESRNTNLSKHFPFTMGLIKRLAQELEGTPARAKLAYLGPGSKVEQHIDRGDYYRQHDRYHLALQTAPGNYLTAGGEQVELKAGELWWFNNQVLHKASNASTEPRIHLIFDVCPDEGMTRAASVPLLTTAFEDPVSLLEEQYSKRQELAFKDIERIVDLYLSARSNPDRWRKLLEQRKLAIRAEKAPLRIVVELMCPELSDEQQRIYERVTAWTLAQLEIGQIERARICDALIEAGGLREISKQWTADRDATLYDRSIVV